MKFKYTPNYSTNWLTAAYIVNALLVLRYLMYGECIFFAVLAVWFTFFFVGFLFKHELDQGANWVRNARSNPPKPLFSVSLSRGYKDAETGEWKYSGNSFSRDELLGLIAVLNTTYYHIVTGALEGVAANE